MMLNQRYNGCKIAVLLLYIGSANCILCTRKEVKKCTSKLDSYFIGSHSLFPAFDEQTLTEVCKESQLSRECLSPLVKSCSRTVTRHLEGQAASFNHICVEEGRQVFLAISPCLSGWNVLEAAASCNNTYQDSLDALEDSAYYVQDTELNTRRCSLLNEYIYCVKNAVNYYCGESAANWQHQMNTLVLSPLLQEINCDIAPPSLSTAEIVGIAVGCVAGVVLIVLLIYCIVYCVMKGRNVKRESEKMTLPTVSQQASQKPHPLQQELHQPNKSSEQSVEKPLQNTSNDGALSS